MNKEVPTVGNRVPIVKMRRVRPGAILPKRWTTQSVGLDVHAHLISEEGRPNTLILPPRTTRRVPTGLAAEPEPGYFLAVWPRSSLSGKAIETQSLLIDPDYRGEIEILMHNGSHETYYIKHEDRIAQLLVMPAIFGSIVEVKELSQTERGERGFGSTGR